MAAVSHGCPAALFRGVNILNTVQEAGRVTATRSSSSPDLVEQALEIASRAADHAGTSVIVHEESTANLRWACNTLTTNGMSTGQTVTVATAVRTGRGTCVGTVSRKGVGPDDLESLVADAAAAARSAPAAEDAAELPEGRARTPVSPRPPSTPARRCSPASPPSWARRCSRRARPDASCSGSPSTR